MSPLVGPFNNQWFSPWSIRGLLFVHNQRPNILLLGHTRLLMTMVTKPFIEVLTTGLIKFIHGDNWISSSQPKPEGITRQALSQSKVLT